MALTHRGDGLTRYIEGRIICGGFRPGQKIPSLRQLMAQFNISMNTARRGIARLVDKGLLEFQHGSGTYVTCKQRFPLPCEIGMVHSINEYATISNTFSGLASLGVEGQSAELGFETRNLMVTAKEMNAQKLESLSRGHEGLILLGGYDAFLINPHLGIPAVGLAMHKSFDGLFSLVDLDPVRAAELSCEFFSRRRCNNVVIVRRNRPNFLFREQLFIRMWEIQGGKIIDVINESNSEFNSDYGYWYSCGSCATDDAERYARNKKRHLAADFHILCIDGKPMFSRLMTPELPTIAINWRMAGAVAAEECIRRVRNPGSVARRIYLTPELYCI